MQPAFAYPTSGITWRSGVAHASLRLVRPVVVILWNVVPAHPHKKGMHLSNRPPRAEEIASGRIFAERLIEIVEPAEVIAVGRVAERHLGYSYVRHPANGGATTFRQDIRDRLR